MREQTLSERVAALEAERDALATEWKVARERQQWLESRLAQARVEGARDALLRYADHVERMKKKLDSTAHVTADSVRCYARDHYHATREEPRPAAPERFIVVPVALSFDAHGVPKDRVGWARINASDAQRIVALAQTTEAK